VAKKRKRRSPFPVQEVESPPTSGLGVERYHADQPSTGVFGFFRDIGVRETIESIVVAIILALMFRAYEAEAFIIPTGSMAPSLQGQHIDLECENCKVNYRSGARSPAQADFDSVISTFCPICQYKTQLRPKLEPNHTSNNGDRILVDKFVYDFQTPERYDVIVFKNPNNGKQNYIKRLIGLPGENILIENGDVYLLIDQGDGTYKREITRKPPKKLKHVLQAVDDTHHIGSFLKSVDWPSRWQSFEGKGSWVVQSSGAAPTFYAESTETENWMRYRHFQPLKNREWPTIKNEVRPSRFNGKLPAGQLIGDQYAYNDSVFSRFEAAGYDEARLNMGLHWVGDLGVHCNVDIKSSSGKLLLDVVEGGAHFVCEIDIATGVASLRCDDANVETKVTFEDLDGNPVDAPKGQTNLKGAGKYKIEFVNADDRLNLWVNEKLVEFDGAQFSRTGIPVPTYSPNDPGDAEPIGVGAVGAEMTVTRLKVLRDIYYTSVHGPRNAIDRTELDNETNVDFNQILTIQQNPDMWDDPAVVKFFEMKKGQTEPMFKLLDSDDPAKDQFLPMGDNSPSSLDGRVWPGPNYFERDLLIGRAMLIYWPHTLNKPKYFPNFGRMGFIK